MERLSKSTYHALIFLKHNNNRFWWSDMFFIQVLTMLVKSTRTPAAVNEEIVINLDSYGSLLEHSYV